jgi:hypothetical protein
VLRSGGVAGLTEVTEPLRPLSVLRPTITGQQIRSLPVRLTARRD